MNKRFSRCLPHDSTSSQRDCIIVIQCFITGNGPAKRNLSSASDSQPISKSPCTGRSGSPQTLIKFLPTCLHCSKRGRVRSISCLISETNFNASSKQSPRSFAIRLISFQRSFKRSNLFLISRMAGSSDRPALPIISFALFFTALNASSHFFCNISNNSSPVLFKRSNNDLFDFNDCIRRFVVSCCLHSNNCRSASRNQSNNSSISIFNASFCSRIKRNFSLLRCN
ncbi:hypothetical protein DERP_007282 [Dermatophagoides pteronyssinus]|uniref:Uncharacterized protein n=1 Tax=Dermatophagoides pteronyssinus TaxID=6956 RepID=A0ABQ8J4K0_DERPT|nr:hypothetical protein DERP_007282 [Dermatophagoides pteronyssinus]